MARAVGRATSPRRDVARGVKGGAAGRSDNGFARAPRRRMNARGGAMPERNAVLHRQWPADRPS